MTIPIVTIAIPTYNRAELLRESLTSVLNQSFTDFEVIIGDNASMDHTGDVVANLKDSRIRYFRHTTNIGLQANLRFVLSQARTDWVANLSDDDLYKPTHLETALEVLKQYPQAAYYTCPAEYFGRSLGADYFRPVAVTIRDTPIYYSPKQAVNFLGIDNPGPIISMVCRRQALQNLYWGPSDYLPVDLLILTQLMAQGGFVFGNKSTTRYRVHASNTSVSARRKSVLRFNCMVWYGIRWLAQFLLNWQLCTLTDIEAHGLNSPFIEGHVIPLVLGLGSYNGSPEFFKISKKVFNARKDIDAFSSRCRLARRVGFWIIPFLERVTQIRVGWQPR